MFHPSASLPSASSWSSSYCPSVANALYVLQPYWLIVLPLDVPDLTASLLLWGPSSQRWRCLWTFLFSNVPTFATSRLQEILTTKGAATWARNYRWILAENARHPHNIQGSFTFRKSTTWSRRLYFPSEGRHAKDFFALKNPTASVGFEPVNLGTKGQLATYRPPKPLPSNCYHPPFSTLPYIPLHSLWHSFHSNFGSVNFHSQKHFGLVENREVS